MNIDNYAQMLTLDEKHQIIREYEEFLSQGVSCFNDDTLILNRASKYIENFLDNQGSLLQIMSLLAMSCYRSFYHAVYM